MIVSFIVVSFFLSFTTVAQDAWQRVPEETARYNLHFFGQTHASRSWKDMAISLVEQGFASLDDAARARYQTLYEAEKEALKSQIALFKSLRALLTQIPNAPVYVENSIAGNQALWLRGENLRVLRELFADADFDQLTPMQEARLLAEGAPTILHALGYIAELWGTQDPEYVVMDDQIVRRISIATEIDTSTLPKGFFPRRAGDSEYAHRASLRSAASRYIMKKRETFAHEVIEADVTAQGYSDVILVYGKAHTLSFKVTFNSAGSRFIDQMSCLSNCESQTPFVCAEELLNQMEMIGVKAESRQALKTIAQFYGQKFTTSKPAAEALRSLGHLYSDCKPTFDKIAQCEQLIATTTDPRACALYQEKLAELTETLFFQKALWDCDTKEIYVAMVLRKFLSVKESDLRALLRFL